MSEHIDINDGRPVGVTGGIHVASAADAAKEAGASRKPDERDVALTELRDHIERVIQSSHLHAHAAVQARNKAQELVFWINAGLARNE